MQCATHPTVETELACSRCEKAICPRCMIQTPVGARCRECANVRKIPTYNMGTDTFVRAAAGAIGAGAVLGTAWWIFIPLEGFFFGAIMGLAVGYGIGELVSLATNRRAGPPLQAIAVAGVGLAFVVRTGLLLSTDEWVLETLRFDLTGLVALGVAAFVAAGRLR